MAKYRSHNKASAHKYLFVWIGTCMIMFFACKKEDEVKRAASAGVLVIPLTDTLRHIITENTLLTNTHPWYIDGWVYVSNEATLNVEPGTVIKVLGKAGGGLIVTRGSSIVAAGTVELPVHMTYDTIAGSSTGCYGIIILGRAPKKQTHSFLNSTSFSGGNDLSYGGEFPGDSSGVLRHLRIDYAGGRSQLHQQWPGGLLLLGVGTKTVVQDVILHPMGGRQYRIKDIKLP